MQERILLVRGDGLGDAVLGTAFMAGLRAGRPDAHITFAVKEGLQSLFADCPWIDALVPFSMPTPAMSSFELGVLQLATARLMHGRSEAFDLLVDLQGYNNPFGGSMHVTATAPARHRIGAPMSWPVAEASMKALYDEVLVLEPCHEVVRYGALARHVGGELAEPTLWNLDRHRQRALTVLRRDEAWLARPKAFLHIGASEPRRRWPRQRFAAVAERLARQDVDVLVVGGSDEGDAVSAVAARAGERGLPLAGTLSPLQLAAVMREGGVFIGNDSGPMHLAAAAGLPVVEISMHPRSGWTASPNAPERLGPWGVPAAVARPDDFLPGCGPQQCTPPAGQAGAHCISQVQVDDVWDALLSLVSFEAAREPSGVAAR